MRLRHTLIAFTLIAAALPGAPLLHAQSADEPSAAPPVAADPLENWKGETFPLPPGFAPEMPSGSESLLFSPGWRDPKAEGFWSYAFVMWIDEPAPDAARLGELLRAYYNGLMSTFAESAGKDISATPVRVDITPVSPGRFEARLRLIDAFATFKPMDLRAVVDSAADNIAGSVVRVRISPQPASHPIWASLESAINRLQASADAPAAKHQARAASPMANYARLVGDEWQLTAPGLMGQLYTTWRWGPGRHSVCAIVDGLGADGKPWRAVNVHYWHPARKETRLLGLSPFDHQMSEGVVTFAPDGESAEGVFDLFHPNHRRKMGLRWTFLGPDKYHDVLLEATGPEGLQVMNQWDHVRVTPPVPPRSLAVDGAEPSERIKPLMRLMGARSTVMGAAGGGVIRAASTVEWLPLADLIMARVVAPNPGANAAPGEGRHLFDVYVFHHAGTRTLRCLALSDLGGVYEGDVAVLSDGALKFDLTGFEADTTARYSVRIDFEGVDIRQRAWRVEGADLSPLLDLRHTNAPSEGP